VSFIRKLSKDTVIYDRPAAESSAAATLRNVALLVFRGFS
jgi:hypothetical protein